MKPLLLVVAFAATISLSAGDSPTPTSPGPPSVKTDTTVLDVTVDPCLGNKALGETMASC